MQTNFAVFAPVFLAFRLHGAAEEALPMGSDVKGPGPRLGDRRRFQRFNVSGRLWGALEAARRMELRNISSAGALVRVEGHFATPPGGEVRVALEPDGPILAATVRYISPEDPPHSALIGLQFTHLSETERVDLIDFLNRTCVQP